MGKEEKSGMWGQVAEEVETATSAVRIFDGVVEGLVLVEVPCEEGDDDEGEEDEEEEANPVG